MKTSSKLRLAGALLGAILLTATSAVAANGRSSESYGDKAYDHDFVHNDTSMVVQKKSSPEVSLSKYNTEDSGIFDNVEEDHANF